MIFNSPMKHRYELRPVYHMYKELFIESLYKIYPINNITYDESIYCFKCKIKKSKMPKNFDYSSSNIYHYTETAFKDFFNNELVKNFIKLNMPVIDYNKLQSLYRINIFNNNLIYIYV